LKEIINRGGEKVSPREVDETLLEHPAVAQALTFAVPHRELGEDVVAAIVPADGARPAEGELRSFVAARLADYKVPRRVLMVDEIPKGPTGKLQRIGMSERLGHLLQVEYVAPRDEVERTLAGIWQDVLHVEKIGVHDNFFLSGGSSLSAVQMLNRLRAAFEVEITLDDFFRRSTLGELAEMVRQAEHSSAPAGQPWGADAPAVVPVQPAGSRPPFFMADFGLGWEMRHVAAHLGPDQPVYGLRPLALLGRERMPRVRAIAQYYVEAVRAVRPHGPYVLGGGCAAGLVAFEMARQLMRQGESVPLVALFDVDFPPAGFLPWLLAVSLLRAPREWARWRRLPPGERKAYLRQSAERWKAKALRFLGMEREDPSTMEPAAWLERQFAALRDSAWRYVPRPYPGRLALFLPEQTSVWFHRDRRLDWRRVALGGCEVCVIPGEHDSSVQEPHARGTAEVLRACIDRAMAADAGRG